MGWAIKRADNTYRGWFANAKDGTLLAGETWEERSTKPVITPTPLTDAQKDTCAANTYDGQKDLQALALVTLDELNILRQAAGIQPRTTAQLRTAFINKRKTL